MKGFRRRQRAEEEEESVFVPMTDMTVSFLFIVMILLAFFAVQFSDEDTVPRSTYEQLLQNKKQMEDEKNKVIRGQKEFIIKRDEEIIKLLLVIENFKFQISTKDQEITSLRLKIDDLKLKLAKAKRLLQTRNETIRNQKEYIKILLATKQKLEKDNQALKKKLQAVLLKLKLQNPLEAYILSAQNKREEILTKIKEKLKIEFPSAYRLLRLL